jgi:hypothetical protein
MPALIALRPVFGQDEANHGTVRYRMESDGLVHVPREAVSFLISKGGFAVAKTMAPPFAETQPSGADPNSLVRLHHNVAGGCSYGGCEYPSDDNGDVLVPADGVAELLGHGFVPVLQDKSHGDPISAPQPSESPRSVPGAKPPSVARPAGG